MSGEESIYPSAKEEQSGYYAKLPGLTKREWMVGQLVTGILSGPGPVPTLAEIWKLADKILKAGDESDPR